MLMAGLEELKAAMTTASDNSDVASIMIESAGLDLENTRKNTKVQKLALQSVQSDWDLTLTEFKRIQKLVQKKVLGSSRLDTVRNALKQRELAVARAKESLGSSELGVNMAKLRVKQARANLELANSRLMELDAAVANVLVKINKSNLTAPISGRLERHMIEPGEVMSAGSSCAYIYDLDYLRATVNVPDRFIAFLDPKNTAAKAFIQVNRPGVELQVRAKLIIPGLPKLTGGNEAGLEVDAEIVYIAQAADPESNTFKVELRLPNIGGALKHGIIARGKIEYLYYPQAIIIPVKAVQVTDAGPRVLVVEEIDGIELVRIRDIEPLSIKGNEVLIGRGLSKGDRLIVSGWKGLVGGEAVNVLFEDGRFITQNPETDQISNKG